MYHIVIVDNTAIARIDYDTDNAVTYCADNVTLLSEEYVTDYAAANSLADLDEVLAHLGVTNDLTTGN